MNAIPELPVVEPVYQAVPEKKEVPAWRTYINSLIGAEISAVSRYFDELVHLMPLTGDSGTLFEHCEAPKKRVAHSLTELVTFKELQADTESSGAYSPNTHSSAAHSFVTEKPSLERGTLGVVEHEHTAILVNGNFNHEFDIEGFLRSLKTRMNRGSRVLTVLYNPYLRSIYHLANRFGFRSGEEPSTFVTETDLRNMAELAGFEVVRLRPTTFIPFKLAGIGTLLNRVLASVPLLRRFGFAWVVILRPRIEETTLPSLSIVIPARNEKGNIEAALQRMPDLGVVPEVIFVEGHSGDGTWEEIQRVVEKYKDKFPLKMYQQTGKGKADAVRLGFANASGRLLTILDADLTMPPELLGRFYEAWTTGKADFVNGNRLVYPMEGQAMKFLNWLGNIFFAKALSFVLDTRLGDSLCGTKLMTKRDYARFGQWRDDFGDFDPFGDFELLFPAASLGLGIMDVPIRYRDRTYGSTNIRRFYHGMMLFKMTAIGYLRLKLGQAPKTK